MSNPDIKLSILITVVSGRDSLRRCVEALLPQVDSSDTEIIVPYDKWSTDVGELIESFPGVRFHYIDDLAIASSEHIPSHGHRLYDRRRAVGLALARGHLIAMTEDHAIPAADWCRQIVTAHLQPFAVIGGAIDNQVDLPLSWALYYCDFGRYGSPLPHGEAEYVSDVNIAYKRRALESTTELWREAYHETTVNWTLKSRGEVIFLDPRMIVYQHRPQMSLQAALKERVQWGRIFAETRVAESSLLRRVVYILGTPVLPALLLSRLYGHMRRQGRTLKQMATVLPLALCLLSAWALGELIGYWFGEPRQSSEPAAPHATVREGSY